MAVLPKIPLRKVCCFGGKNRIFVLNFWFFLSSVLGFLSSVLGFCPQFLGLLSSTLEFSPSALQKKFWYFCQNIYLCKYRVCHLMTALKGRYQSQRSMSILYFILEIDDESIPPGWFILTCHLFFIKPTIFSPEKAFC